MALPWCSTFPTPWRITGTGISSTAGAGIEEEAVPPPFNSVLAWRSWEARRMARAMEEPDVWLAKIDEVERLWYHNGEAAERLTSLLLSYKEAEREMIARQVKAHVTGATPPPPLPMLTSLPVTVATTP